MGDAKTRASRRTGAALAVALSLAAASARADGPAPEPRASSGSSEALETWAVLSFTLGGSALAIGGVAGVLAISEKSTLDGACTPTKHCPTSSQPDIDHVNTDASVATVSLAIGAAAVGAGVLLLLLRPHADETRSVGVDLGPGSFLVRGSF